MRLIVQQKIGIKKFRLCFCKTQKKLFVCSFHSQLSVIGLIVLSSFAHAEKCRLRNSCFVIVEHLVGNLAGK